MCSKLDVYQICLSKRSGTLKDVVIKKNNITDSPITRTKIFNSFYRNLLELIGGNVFCIDAKKMGLTIFKGKGERINNILTSHSSSFVIEGFIDAGPYNSIRKLAKLSDLSKRRTINKNDIVTDRYYFYLYFPWDSKIGILMVQSKENSSIRRAIKPFIERLFKTDATKGCRVNIYYPKWLKEHFIDGANLCSLTYEQEFVTQIQTEEETLIKSEDFDVKVTIVPKTDTETISNSSTIINKIGSLFGIKIGTDTFSLSSFTKKKGVMRNDDFKKSLPFVIDKEDEIHPIIHIDEYISADENGDFKREDLKSLCDNLLDNIKLEIYGFEHR